MSLAKFASVLLAVLFASSPAWAHKPMVLVEDNGDGTIYIEVGFSTGDSGAGHKIIIKEKATEKVLSEHKVPAESALDLPMPKVPYMVVFDAGEGHDAEQEGPFVEPKEDAPDEPEAVPAPQAEAAPPPPQAKTPAQAATAPQAAPVVLSRQPGGPGVEMALKMMLTTQIVTAVLAAFLFGAVVFWIGYSVGKAQVMTKR